MSKIMREKVTGRNYENKQTNCSQERNHQGGQEDRRTCPPTFGTFGRVPLKEREEGKGKEMIPTLPDFSERGCAPTIRPHSALKLQK